VALNNNAPTTIPALIARRVAAHPREVILRKKQRGIWVAVTWAELAERVRQIGMALVSSESTSGQVVVVLSDTRPEAVCADLGVLSIGCVSACISGQDSAERLERTLRDTTCHLLFVENEEQLDKVLSVRERCHALRRIVIFDMKGLRELDDPMCESLAAFLARGIVYDRANPAAWESAIRAITPERPAVLLAPADGADQMLSHREVLRLVTDVATRLGQHACDERIAFLPMSGMLERALGLYTALFTRTVSNYLEGAATLTENLREVQPTVLGAPPVVWERFRTRIGAEAEAATWLQGALFNWAIGAAASPGLGGGIARRLVLDNVRRNLGLARLRIGYTGTMAVPAALARWYRALGVDLRSLDRLAAHDAVTEAKLHALAEDLSCAA
jgi:long-chain acyl-CoA synthetase